MRETSGNLRLAYLVTIYPKLSHTFIAAEIAALRELGADVHTFSVRRPPAAEVRSTRDEREAAATTVLLDSGSRRLRAVARFVLRHPVAVLTGLRQALRTGGPGLKSRVWQVLYLAESLALAQAMFAQGLRHVHVHLANNAADIARLAVTVGSVADGERWTWSLAMHGPTELADVTRFDLAAKIDSALFVACITDFCRSQLMTLVDTRQWPKLHIVRMGIDPNVYRHIVRERNSDQPLRILFVGRLVPEKAPQILVRAVERLPAGSAVVRLIGDGPLRAELEASARLVDGGTVVDVVGPVGQDDLLPHYEWADVFCLPSFAEGLPVVIMEAMATGLPVITTAIAGIPELVVNRETGVVVPPGRSEFVAAAIDELRDPGVRRTLGDNGCEAVLRQHVAGDNANVLLKLFVEYLQA